MKKDTCRWFLATVVAVACVASMCLAAPFEQLDLNEWSIDGTKVTATAAELNIMDGVTVSASQINAAGGGSTATLTPTLITNISAGVVAVSNITAKGTLRANSIQLTAASSPTMVITCLVSHAAGVVTSNILWISSGVITQMVAAP